AVDVEEGMEDAAVAQIDLRGFDLTLADVLVPGLEHAHQERLREEVEVVAHGHVRHAHGAPELRPVEDAAVDVRQHLPEASERRCGNGDTENGQISLDDRSRVRPPPKNTVALRPREERSRIATAE